MKNIDARPNEAIKSVNDNWLKRVFNIKPGFTDKVKTLYF